ncbi:phosphate acyltransferase [Staphylococcus carnosus]|uniref:Phosphate butyryltransferase n=2 Tax=Staphylococcus carnosus TaxID=1281 RepID=B9DNR9_STACT|nr:phosphate acyltransferase [Staphylococcus carnosus]ANZ33299.1 phosphate butyryltransferase [Staphylococcus carnosus]KKB26211.1 phosphate butyryltransferase [Staphylococcus carnosus]KOR13589.1 phosphate butyryltransferase [Staphylococcus carnosus]PNZ96535.1 phosphate butyryltransferase [Staphylococcus carnosus]QPT04178.1 phosphate butyryltransferase [Staphylococcus carnosus]
MQFQTLVSDSKSLSGNIGVMFADDELIISAIIKILKQTNAHVTLYGIKDPTELIRSFNIDGDFLNRIHLRTFEDKENVYKKCADDLTNSSIDVLMKGNVSSAEILSFILQHKSFIDENNFLNHVACFEIPSYHKMLMISDVALNILPSIDDRIKMIKNIESFSKGIGYNHLNIGLLSSVEKPTNKIPSSIDAAEISMHFSDDSFVSVEGPFGFDNAIDKESAIEKGLESDIAGNLDALIVPYLDVGNTLYKSLTYFAHAKVASLILGATFPVILTSRSDTIENKVNSAILALRTLL